MKPARAVFLSIPLAALGSLLAHALAYRAAVPGDAQRARLYEATGHSYLAYAPMFVAVCAGVVVVGAIVLALRFARGRRALPPQAWPFALLPVLMFTVQEHAERFLSTGDFPVAAAAEPTFLVGLWLQVAVGLLMYVVARAILRVAEGLGRILGELLPAEAIRAAARLLAPVPEFAPPRIPALALRRAGRAPPSRHPVH